MLEVQMVDMYSPATQMEHPTIIDLLKEYTSHLTQQTPYSSTRPPIQKLKDFMDKKLRIYQKLDLKLLSLGRLDTKVD